MSGYIVVLPVTARALQQKGERERERTRERGGEREVLINWFIDKSRSD